MSEFVSSLAITLSNIIGNYDMSYCIVIVTLYSLLIVGALLIGAGIAKLLGVKEL